MYLEKYCDNISSASSEWSIYEIKLYLLSLQLDLEAVGITAQSFLILVVHQKARELGQAIEGMSLLISLSTNREYK